MQELQDSIIEFAKKEDLPQIAEIEKCLFTRPWSLSNFNEAFLNPVANLWTVKDHNHKLCAYLCMYVSVDEGEIVTIAVEPDERGKGYAKALLATAQTFIREQSLQRIVLEVRVSNGNAISLYEKMGFENLGIRKGFYEAPKEDAYIMAWENHLC